MTDNRKDHLRNVPEKPTYYKFFSLKIYLYANKYDKYVQGARVLKPQKVTIPMNMYLILRMKPSWYIQVYFSVSETEL